MIYELIIFILVNAGLSIGIARSKFTESFRSKVKSINSWAGQLVSCVMCLSFWCSIPVYLYVFHTIDRNTIGFMFIGSITSYLLNRANVINLNS